MRPQRSVQPRQRLTKAETLSDLPCYEKSHADITPPSSTKEAEGKEMLVCEVKGGGIDQGEEKENHPSETEKKSGSLTARQVNV